MSALLTVRTPGRQPFTLVIDSRLEFGRDCAGVIVADQRVSRRHVAIGPSTAGGVVVTDLGSSNGTQVDHVTISGPTTVEPGGVIVIGDTELHVLTDVAPPTPPATEIKRRSSEESSIERVAAAADRTDWPAEVLGVGNEPGTLTVMFTDIESSTERAVSMGDQAWYELLRRHEELVSAHIDAHHGRIVKHQGDGYMCCFRSARSAILTSIGIQRDLERQRAADPPNAIAVRMGVHTGEVLVADDGDLFGKHVVVAARIGAAAAGGEVLVSEIVRQIAEPRGDVSFVDQRVIALKGITDVETVWLVDWRAYAG